MLDPHSYNQYLLNINMLTGKPCFTPGRMLNPLENYSNFHGWNGMDRLSQGIGMGLHDSFMDYLYHVENIRVAMI